MEKEILEKIANLTSEDLEFYKKLMSFFDLLGLNKEDLTYLIKLVKSFPEMVTKINQVLQDQKFLNDRYLEIKNNQKTIDKQKTVLEDFNTEGSKLNPYGR